MLRDQYRCPHFRILIIGRANAGKTTILEKVCGVEKGTKPVIIHAKDGKLNESLMHPPSDILLLLDSRLKPCGTHLIPSIEASQWCTTLVCSLIGIKCQRGDHDIEHGITYKGSNFIFHDSQGFESGAKEEIEIVWDFIEKQSAATKLKDQLHVIWYHLAFVLHLNN